MYLHWLLFFIIASCGTNTVKGPPGSSCTVNQLTNGAQIICTDGTTANIVNGETGLTGEQGPQGLPGIQGPAGTPGYLSPYTIMTIIEPCGHNSSPYKEVLLGFLNGQVYVSFSANGNAMTVRNTILPDGNYVDTDDSHCWFYIDTHTNGDRFIEWNGGLGMMYTAATQTWSNL